MDEWTAANRSLDLDPVLKEDIRDCRTLLLSDKAILNTYKNLVMEWMKAHSEMAEKNLLNFSYKFHVTIKALLKIGAGISKSKEFEDIFDDLADKLADTCLRANLTLKDVDDFFHALNQTFDALLETMNFTRHRHRFSKTWFRYLEGIRKCLLHIIIIMQADPVR
jgi:hypothetical protein